MLGLLYYSDTLVLSQNIASINGRSIANNDFLKELIKNQQDEIVLFTSSSTERDFLKNFLGSLASQVMIVTLLESVSFLKKNRLTALHVLGPDLYRGFYFRDKLAEQAFPVTGITHSLGHEPFLEWMLLNLIHQPKPFDRLICTSPTAEEAIQKIESTLEPHLKNSSHLKTTVLPLGISEISRVDSPKQKLGLSNDSLVLLYFGRFSQYTKVDLIPLLLNFRDILKKTSKKVFLILAGASGQENYPSLLKEVIDELNLTSHVRFFLNPDQNKKELLFSAADLFMAPGDNFQETFGLSVVEALAYEVPVIASDWNGYRSLIQNGENGFLIPTTSSSENSIFSQTSALQIDSLNHHYFSQQTATNSKQWIQKTLDLIENDEKRKNFSERAGLQGKNFFWRNILPHYWDLWKELSNFSEKSKTENHQITLNYPHVFSQDASSHLQPSDLLKTTERGMEVLHHQFPLRIYTAMEEIISPEFLGEILNLFKQENSMESVNLSGSDQSMMSLHILWLMKYGLLEKR